MCTADYSRKLDVFNRGFGGYNTEWAIPVFEQVRTTRFFKKPALSLPCLVSTVTT